MKKPIMFALIALAAVGLMLTGCAREQSASANTISPETLQVQLIPSRDAAYLDAQRLPMQQLLSAQLGMPVVVTVATDYNALIEGMASEQIHVGLLATTAYVLAADEGHAEAILASLRFDVNDFGVQQRDQPLVSGYKAQLVAGVNSGIRSVADLRGRQIAIASFTSTSGFVWPANLLADNGLNPETDVTWVNVGGHDNAILAVYNGEADAAFTFKDARSLFDREAFHADLMDKVVLVTDTSDIPNDTISVIPRLDPQLKQRIADAFMAMMEEPAGREIMQRIYNHEGYAPVSDSEYNQVRTYLERSQTWSF